jgi:hypothetical protein
LVDTEKSVFNISFLESVFKAFALFENDWLKKELVDWLPRSRSHPQVIPKDAAPVAGTPAEAPAPAAEVEVKTAQAPAPTPAPAAAAAAAAAAAKPVAQRATTTEGKSLSGAAPVIEPSVARVCMP